MFTEPELVSVVIPIYNVEVYLRRCIESVLAQTHKNIEVMLLDDGSTDGGADICSEYVVKNSRVKYFYHDNMGLAKTRNRGIECACGEYITFLDSDDWFEPDFIRKILSDMKITESEIGLCDIYYANITNQEKHIVKLRFTQTFNFVAEDKSTINKARLFAWGKIYKKALFIDFNIRYPDISYEDICTPLLIACACSVSYTPEPLINYLENRPESLSNTAKNISDVGNGLVWLEKELTSRKLYEKLRPEFKKIALAQFRFVARRFGCLPDEDTKRDLRTLGDKIGELLPELIGLSDKRYYVSDNWPIFRAVLDRCLPFKEQIVNTPAESNSHLPFDEAILMYNLAELIMADL